MGSLFSCSDLHCSRTRQCRRAASGWWLSPSEPNSPGGARLLVRNPPCLLWPIWWGRTDLCFSGRMPFCGLPEHPPSSASVPAVCPASLAVQRRQSCREVLQGCLFAENSEMISVMARSGAMGSLPHQKIGSLPPARKMHLRHSPRQACRARYGPADGNDRRHITLHPHLMHSYIATHSFLACLQLHDMQLCLETNSAGSNYSTPKKLRVSQATTAQRMTPHIPFLI